MKDIFTRYISHEYAGIMLYKFKFETNTGTKWYCMEEGIVDSIGHEEAFNLISKQYILEEKKKRCNLYIKGQS